MCDVLPVAVVLPRRVSVPFEATEKRSTPVRVATTRSDCVAHQREVVRLVVAPFDVDPRDAIGRADVVRRDAAPVGGVEDVAANANARLMPRWPHMPGLGEGGEGDEERDQEEAPAHEVGAVQAAVLAVVSACN